MNRQPLAVHKQRDRIRAIAVVVHHTFDRCRVFVCQSRERGQEPAVAQAALVYLAAADASAVTKEVPVEFLGGHVDLRVESRTILADAGEALTWVEGAEGRAPMSRFSKGAGYRSIPL